MTLIHTTIDEAEAIVVARHRSRTAPDGANVLFYVISHRHGYAVHSPPRPPVGEVVAVVLDGEVR